MTYSRKTLYILLVSTAFAFFYNAVSPNGIPLFPQEPKTEKVVSFSDTTFDTATIKLIDAETALKYFNEENVVFIDGRDKWDYSEGHIPGAINLPEYKIDELGEDIAQLDKNANYIVYCSGEDCDASKRLAAVLMKLGFAHILVYSGGFDEWNKYSYPTEGGNE